MSDLAPRLSASITALIEHFKLQPDGIYSTFGPLDLTIISRVGDAEEPVTQGELVQILSLPKTTVASAVRRLEQRGFVRRVASLEDGRARNVAVTTAGQETAKALQIARLTASRSMLNALPDEEQQTLVELLERIVAAGPGSVKGGD